MIDDKEQTWEQHAEEILHGETIVEYVILDILTPEGVKYLRVRVQ